MFKENVIKAFKKVKNDITSLKSNISEWVVFYNKKHNSHEKRIELLEQRIIFLERKELEREQGWQ